jgi:hypothetical protein
VDPRVYDRPDIRTTWGYDQNFWLTTRMPVKATWVTTRMTFVSFSVSPDTRVCERNSGQCSSTLKNSTFCRHCIYVFCIYLRANADFCPVQHKLIGFNNRDEKCLQRGTDWVFKWSSLCLCHLHHKLIGFITDMKSVYSAVRTGPLNKAVCAPSLKG